MKATMNRGVCKQCGGTFWESSKGTRGEDICDNCEENKMTKKIITSFEYPPIPIRTFDWCAYYNGEEENGNYGYGATEAEAIKDLIDNYEETLD